MNNQQSDVDKILAEKLIKIGIDLKMPNQDYIDRRLNPALAEINKKLKQFSKDSELGPGSIFGKGFFLEKAKELTGFDTSLYTGTKALIQFGMASKDLNVDNKEFYNSLGLVGKSLVNVASFFNQTKKARQEDADQARSDLADLDEQANRAAGMNRLLESSDALSANLEVLGPEAAEAAKGLDAAGTAAEAATIEIGTFATVATAGLALVVAAVAAIGIGFYKMLGQAITARAEVKKFDELFGGGGPGAIQKYTQTLKALNRSVWTLGYSLEKVNEVVYAATAAGLSFSRATDTQLVSSILELSGATGEASTAIGELYTGLLKTTRIGVPAIKEMGNTFIAFNRSVASGTYIGRVSFSQFKEAIDSSANALAIAASRGDEFTMKMTKDLTSLAGLANSLSLSISGINNMFEEAGNLLTSQDSKFRALLAVSGGAGMNEMLTNQFDKTDAMLKATTFLQNLNNQFGKNIAITAQVAQQVFNVPKEMAIKLINMRKEAIDEIRKAQQDISGLQTNATRDAFEKVNSGLSDMWQRIKTMFMVFFQNAFGNSSGMQNLVSKLEGLLGRVKNMMESGGWLPKLTTAIDKLADWVGNKAADAIQWISTTLDNLMSGKTTFFDIVMNLLKQAAYAVGRAIGWGFRSTITGPLGHLLGEDKSGINSETGLSLEDLLDKNASNLKNTLTNPLYNQLSVNKKRESEISSERDQYNKFAPDAITYGKRADNTVGYMSIAEKQYLLEKEKKELEDQDREVQKQIAYTLEKIEATLIGQKIAAKKAAASMPKAPNSRSASNIDLETSGNSGYGTQQD
jgi:hypothetical protein